MIPDRRLPFTPYVIVNNGDKPPLTRIYRAAEPGTNEHRLRTALRDRIEDFHDIAEAVLEGRADRTVLKMCEIAVKRCAETLEATRGGPCPLDAAEPDGAG